MMSSKLACQTIEDVKSPDLVVKDTFGRIDTFKVFFILKDKLNNLYNLF